MVNTMNDEDDNNFCVMPRHHLTSGPGLEMWLYLHVPHSCKSASNASEPESETSDLKRRVRAML